MNLSPAEVDKLSLRQIMTAWNGFVEAHSSKGADKLSDGEAQELFNWIDTPELIPDPKPLPRYKWDGNRLSIE